MHDYNVVTTYVRTRTALSYFVHAEGEDGSGKCLACSAEPASKIKIVKLTIVGITCLCAVLVTVLQAFGKGCEVNFSRHTVAKCMWIREDAIFSGKRCKCAHVQICDSLNMQECEL